MDGKPDMNGDFVRRWTLVCVCSKFVIFLGESCGSWKKRKTLMRDLSLSRTWSPKRVGEEWGVADHRKPTDLL